MNRWKRDTQEERKEEYLFENLTPREDSGDQID